MLGRALPLRNDEGRIVKWFGTCTDIDELKAAQAREAELLAELERRATHDPLTGLANRDLLFEQLELLLDQRHRTGIAVAFVDLDGFKLINDALGHLAGDRVLAEVGRRLRSAVRQGDVVARMGGDEFVVVGEAADEMAANDLAERMKSAIEGLVAVGGAEVTVRASVGHAFVAPGVHVHAGEALSRADHDMYATKRAPRH
jgi:diguanylate cyclase (GGDEF)-like protein